MNIVIEEISEIFGALAGDGCLSKYNAGNRKRYVVLFTGHIKNDFDYYNEVIRPTLFKVFCTRGYLYKRHDDNTVRLFVYTKNVFNFFEIVGFPIGKKEKIKIPSWIKNHKKNKIAFVRGVFNTDGSVYSRYSKRYTNHKKHYKNYAIIQFKMKNKEVIVFVAKTLKELGLNPNKISKVKNVWVVRLTSQKSVDNFFEVFKINHNYHIDRYKGIRKI